MSDDVIEPPHEHPGHVVAWHPPSLEAMQELLPQYEFIALIGQGGMGAVYKATQISLDRPVAVKVLPPGADDGEMGFTERFRIEARMMAKMNHPGIVSVHDFGIAGGDLLFIVMEFVDGTDVAKMIQAQRKLEPHYALAITAHICDALLYAHNRQVVHGDIKPANVLIGMDGQVKVADFGLARFNDAGQVPGSSVTLGTPDYAAPEIMTEGATVDGRADLYAVGVMLYNMLTGEIPRGIFQLPSEKIGCDPRLDDIVRKAMEQEPERRYQTAYEIRHDLDRIFAVPVAKAVEAGEEKPKPATRHVEPPPPHRLVKHGILGWTLAVIAAITVLGYLVWKDYGTPPKVVVISKTPPSVENPSVSLAPTQQPPPPTGEPRPRPPMQEPRPEGQRPGDGRPRPDPSRPRPPGNREPGTPPPVMSQRPPEPLPNPQPPPVETEATRRLGELDAQFQAALDRDVTKPGNAAVAALDAKYLAALDRSLSAASKAPDQTEALALSTEKKRVEAHQSLPDEDPADMPASVKSLRSTYRTELGRIAAAGQPLAVSLHDKYAQVLAAYHDELAKAGKDDEARRVEKKQKQAAANRILAMASGPSHDIEYITEALRKAKGGSAEGILLKGAERFETPESFAPPVEITVVAKTDDRNLRLGYAANQLIFNWEVRETSLRVDGGVAGGLHKEGAGQIPRNTFVTIRWVVKPTSQTVFVDDEKRYEHIGNYAGLNKPMAVFASGSTVTVKSLKVKPLDTAPKQKRALVQAPGTFFAPLITNQSLYGDTREHSWESVPPLFGAHMFSQQPREKSPVLNLKVMSDGVIYMACTTRWGRGGSGGEWMEELITRPQLEAQGWREVDTGGGLKSNEKDVQWTVFSRVCKAGEQFQYRTEKYIGPIVIVDEAVCGLPDAGIISEDRVLEPGEYRNKRNVLIGRHDEAEPKKLYAVNVTSKPGVRIVDSTPVIEKGKWMADGTRFIRSRLQLQLDGEIDAKNSIFEACEFNKKGTWFIPWYSTKWTFVNCVFSRQFISGWKPVDVGAQVRRCTFYGVKFDKIPYKEDAAEEVKRYWMTIQNCRFVECQIPESLLIATRDCVFENCTFGEPEPSIPMKSPMVLRAYSTEPGIKIATGPNRTVEVLEASKIPNPAGAVLKHQRVQSVISFVGPPGT